MAAFEVLATEAGLPPTIARSRAEDALARIEGALIVATGTGRKSVFARAIADIQATFLAPEWG